MWKITWIGSGEKPKILSVCSPSSVAAISVYGAMLGAGLRARLWTPDGHLFRGDAG